MGNDAWITQWKWSRSEGWNYITVTDYSAEFINRKEGGLGDIHTEKVEMGKVVPRDHQRPSFQDAMLQAYLLLDKNLKESDVNLKESDVSSSAEASETASEIKVQAFDTILRTFERLSIVEGRNALIRLLKKTKEENKKRGDHRYHDGRRRLSEWTWDGRF